MNINSPGEETNSAVRLALGFSGHAGDASAPNLQSVFKTFLQGSGIPCPQLFEEAKAHFHPVIDLAGIEEDGGGFRARMFCWAATGSFDRTPDMERIIVSLVSQHTHTDSADKLLHIIGSLCWR